MQPKIDLFKFLKTNPSGDLALSALRQRMGVQMVSPKLDPMSRRLLPIMEEYKDQLKGRILDIGCYTGYLHYFLGRPDGYVGIDTYPSVIQVAKDFSQHTDFRVADYRTIEGEFDVVWCANVPWATSGMNVGKTVEHFKTLAPKVIMVTNEPDAKAIGNDRVRFGELYVTVLDA